MARYTGPKTRIARKFGAIFEMIKHSERRSYPPGQHGMKKEEKSEYAIQLMENKS
jgi:small subunit ribosomal protein S4